MNICTWNSTHPWSYILLHCRQQVTKTPFSLWQDTVPSKWFLSCYFKVKMFYIMSLWLLYNSRFILSQVYLKVFYFLFVEVQMLRVPLSLKYLILQFNNERQTFWSGIGDSRAVCSTQSWSHCTPMTVLPDIKTALLWSTQRTPPSFATS